MKDLCYRDLEILLPTSMFVALKERYEYQVETEDVDDIGFDKYLMIFFHEPLDLLRAYLEWEGILGYDETIIEFIRNFDFGRNFE